MTNIFKIKISSIVTFCMVLFSITSFAQNYSDQTIGFPVAVASNTKYNEIASDGFEDYVSNPECEKASHFDYKAQLKQNNISISTTQSHTDTKSLKVVPKQKAIVRKQVIPSVK